MTRRRRAANPIFSVPAITGVRLPPRGRVITCSLCNKGGGTLVSTEDGAYKHEHCGRFFQYKKRRKGNELD